MAEAIMTSIMSTTLLSKPRLHPFPYQPNSPIVNYNAATKLQLRQSSILKFGHGLGLQVDRGSTVKVKALPDWPLMAVLVEHIPGQRDLVTYKSLWHLSDEAIKSVYTFYIMFTVWGCCFFGATKDPYYDAEYYRKDGGDGTGHWVYEKQEDIEESARAALWRDELIEEIEQKVGSLRELEEAGRKEQLIK